MFKATARPGLLLICGFREKNDLCDIHHRQETRNRICYNHSSS